MSDITIGLVFADSMEYSPFEKFVTQNGEFEKFSLYGDEGISTRLTKGDKNIFIKAVKAGNGKVNAAGATANLIAEFKTDMILNAGLSGAVYGVKREDFVAGTSLRERRLPVRHCHY